MIEHLRRLHLDTFITQPEMESAVHAENAGSPDHTLGYELEVLGSAAPDVPNVMGNLTKDRENCAVSVNKYGYGLENDGLYELQSPAAMHPHPLVIATKGIMRNGWLPNCTSGMVTAHVSVGTSRPEKTVYENQYKFITLLRALEQLRGTTPNRLMSPVTQSQDDNSRYVNMYAWNQKGELGVYGLADNSMETWEGKNNRIELRTLGYFSPKQFGTVLTAAYYLSRGLLSEPGSAPANIFESYEKWLHDYFEDQKLPLATANEVNGYDNIDILRRYIKPYADHLADAPKAPLWLKTKISVLALQEEFGLTKTAFDFED